MIIHKRNVKKLLIIGIIIVGIIALYYISQQVTLVRIQVYRDILAQFVQDHYGVSALLYIALYVMVVACAIPITIILTIVGGYLFGVILGIIFSIISVTTGGLIIFLLVRYYGGHYIQQRYHQKLMQFNQEIAIYGHWYLLALQIFPMTPPLLPYALAGLTRMSSWSMASMSALGLIPGTLIYAWMGSYLHVLESEKDLFSWTMIIMLCILALCALLPVLWLKYYRSR